MIRRICTGKKENKKNVEKKNFEFFSPWPPMSVHKKFQPIRSSHLAGYKEHMNVLFYYLDISQSSFLLTVPL